jgi:hypothetical protein
MFESNDTLTELLQLVRHVSSIHGVEMVSRSAT